MKKYLTDKQDAHIMDIILEETQKAAYEEQSMENVTE